MPNKAQEDAVINPQSIRDLGKQLGFEWPMVAYELGFSRAEISQIHTLTPEKKSQAQKMLEHWYERSWDKLNKTKLLQEALERSGRNDLADKLRCLHWGHQKLSSKGICPYKSYIRQLSPSSHFDKPTPKPDLDTKETASL